MVREHKLSALTFLDRVNAVPVKSRKTTVKYWSCVSIRLDSATRRKADRAEGVSVFLGTFATAEWSDADPARACAEVASQRRGSRTVDASNCVTS